MAAMVDVGDKTTESRNQGGGTNGKRGYDQKSHEISFFFSHLNPIKPPFLMVKNQGYSMTYSQGYSHSTTISHVEDLGVPPWRWT